MYINLHIVFGGFNLYINKNIMNNILYNYIDLYVYVYLCCSNSTNAIQCYMKITNKIP